MGFCFAVLALCSSVAQQSQHAASLERNVRLRSWGIDEGLPSNGIHALAQTLDRYLWIGTPNGLARFDGNRFKIFDHTNTPELSEDSVSTLTAAPDGSLWIGTEGGGVSVLRAGRFTVIDRRSGLTNEFVRSISLLPDGTALIGTDDGLFRYHGHILTRMDSTPNFPRMSVGAILRARDGSLWVGGSNLVHVVNDRPQQVVFQSKDAQVNIKTIRQSSSHTILVGTVGGLFALDQTLPSHPVHPIYAAEDTVRALDSSADGTLWIATTKSGLLRYSQDQLEQISLPTQVTNKLALCLLVDRNHDLWIGTQTGLVQLRPMDISTLHVATKRSADSSTVFQDRFGSLWFTFSGIYTYRDGHVQQMLADRLPQKISIHNVFVDSKRRLWIGTDGAGIYLYAQGRLMHLGMKDGLVNNFVTAFQEDREGTIWVGTDGGVSRFGSEGGRVHGSVLLGYASVHDILMTGDDDTLIGTDQGLRWFRSGHALSNRVTDALSRAHIWSLFRQSNGDIWIGSSNDGVYRVHANQVAHWDTRSGLPSNRIFKILEDTHHTLWFSGLRGAFTVQESSFNQGARGYTRFPLHLFIPNTELDTPQLFGGIQSAGALGYDGHVWFPGFNGPVRMPLDATWKNHDMTPSIDEITVNGRASRVGSSVTLDPGTSRVSIHFLVVMPYSAASIRYQYRLSEVDKDWVTADSPRLAEYTGVPSGRHTFYVRAFDLSRPGKIWQSRIELNQTPHFYERTWFRIVCVLLFGGIAWLAHFWRLRNIRLRYQSILEERTRVARELHDTVIQGCTSVSALLEAHPLVQTDTAKQEALLEHARFQIRDTIDHARKAVWNLRNDTSASDLATQLRDLAVQFEKDFDFLVTLSVSGRPVALVAERQYGVLMVTREALFNALRHSSTRSCWIRVVYSAERLTIEVVDEGRGFDLAVVGQPGSAHYGILGMTERMTEMGGTLSISSNANVGTSVRLTLPY